MPRGWNLGAAVLASVTVAAGCGGSGQPDDEARVRETVNDFYEALGQNDGKRACAALTDRARREIESIDRRHRPCVTAAVAQFGGLAAPRITKVEIDGGRAVVGLLDGEGGNAVLVKKRGEWEIDVY